MSIPSLPYAVIGKSETVNSTRVYPAWSWQTSLSQFHKLWKKTQGSGVQNPRKFLTHCYHSGQNSILCQFSEPQIPQKNKMKVRHSNSKCDTRKPRTCPVSAWNPPHTANSIPYSVIATEIPLIRDSIMLTRILFKMQLLQDGNC